ncbi:MAG: hypothetical protein IPM14_14865 [bacterium]|nr:hypothetical protein [bacterium]
MMKSVSLFLFAAVIWIESFAQTVYQPVSSDIYNLLERLFIKGVIEYHSEIKPIPRKDIATYLLEALSERKNLTGLDLKEIEFYCREYADEISFISDAGKLNLPRTEFFTSGQTDRFRLFNYRDSLFSFNLDPILGIEIGNRWGSGYSHRWNGLEFFGYYSDNWGYSLDFRDNLESGDNIDDRKVNVPETGINISKNTDNSIQYSVVNAQVNYGWNSGNLSLGKYAVNIGNGRAGQIINSSKAPSFPMIRLDFRPVHWLNFIYFHGFLKSDVPDSSTYRSTSVEGRESISDIPKYIASHLLSFYIAEDLSLSIGESIVYSDNVEPVYLIPVMFFRLADHYLSSSSNTGDNAQLFADASYRISPINSKVYGSVFIDELSIEKVLEGENLSSIGYTIGTEFSDLIIPNSGLVLEYTRMQPFVYTNSNDAHTYDSHKYQLGHWVGSNSDIFYASYRQNILRGLYAKLSGWYFRKGQTELPEQQYQLPYPSTLYGARRTDKVFNLEITWQPVHNLFVKGYYNYADISDEEQGRTQEFMLGSINNFGFAVFYGM